MTRYVFKMPDLGEGTVEAEIVAWHVKVGDFVDEDQVIAEVMTEKAAVELPSPVTGRVLSQTGAPGDMVPVGADLIVFDTDSGEERDDVRQRHRLRLLRGSRCASSARAAQPCAVAVRASRGPLRPRKAPRSRDGVAGDAPARPRGRHRSRAGRGLGAEWSHHATGLRGGARRRPSRRRRPPLRRPPARRRSRRARAPRRSRSSACAA